MLTAVAGLMVKCKVCPKSFRQMNSMHCICSLPCALKLPAFNRKEAKAKARAERETDRRKKEAQKTHPQLTAEAQEEFNAFIRARDIGKPCICCNSYPQSDALKGGEWDAGHYRSRGACPELRFDERNAHAQLKQCNRRAWDVAAYRANLIGRIGLAEVEDLEGPCPPKKYSRDELRAIRDDYRARAKALTTKEK